MISPQSSFSQTKRVGIVPPSVIAVFSLLSPSVKVMSRPRRHLSNSQESADGGEKGRETQGISALLLIALLGGKRQKKASNFTRRLSSAFSPPRLGVCFGCLRTRNRDPDFPSLIATFTFFSHFPFLCFFFVSCCILSLFLHENIHLASFMNIFIT